MKLLGSRTSPFVRKIRVLLAEKHVACEFVEENVWSPDAGVARFNPLNKVPALVLDGGECLYDSQVIAEYVDSLPGINFIPATLHERVRVRRDEALGDGIAEAGVTIFLERKREPARQDAAWLARQAAKVDAGIEAWARSVSARNEDALRRLSLGDIACGCALLWLEFRLPEFRWREDAALRAWAQNLESRASFADTRPPG